MRNEAKRHFDCKSQRSFIRQNQNVRVGETVVNFFENKILRFVGYGTVFKIMHFTRINTYNTIN